MKRIAFFLIVIIILFFRIPVNAITVQDDSGNGDRVSIMTNIEVGEKTSGDVVSIAGNVDVKNDVAGDVVVIFGNICVDAAVAGDVVSVIGTVTLTDRAVIAGDLVSIGAINKADGAVIRGQDILISLGKRFNMEFLVLFKIIALFVSLMIILIFGLPTLLIASRRFGNMELCIEANMGRKLAIGFLTLIGSLIILILFCWTLVIPLAYLVLILFAKIAAFIYFGKVLAGLFDVHMNIYLEFATGLLLVALIKIIIVLLIPQGMFIQSMLLSGLADFIVNSFGTGILIDSKFGKTDFA